MTPLSQPVRLAVALSAAGLSLALSGAFDAPPPPPRYLQCPEGGGLRTLSGKALADRAGPAPEGAVIASAAGRDLVDGKVLDPADCVGGFVPVGALQDPAALGAARPGYRLVPILAAGVVPQQRYDLRVGPVTVVHGVVAVQVDGDVVDEGSGLRGPSMVRFEVPEAALDALNACRSWGALEVVEATGAWAPGDVPGDCESLGRPRAEMVGFSALVAGTRPQEHYDLRQGEQVVVRGVRAVLVAGRALESNPGLGASAAGAMPVLFEVPPSALEALAACTRRGPLVATASLTRAQPGDPVGSCQPAARPQHDVWIY